MRDLAHGEADCKIYSMTRGGLVFHLVGKRELKESYKLPHDIIRFGFLQENTLTLVAGRPADIESYMRAK